MCELVGDPLVTTIANRDLSVNGAWKCQPIEEVVSVAKWNYYVAKTLSYLEEIGLPPP